LRFFVVVRLVGNLLISTLPPVLFIELEDNILQLILTKLKVKADLLLRSVFVIAVVEVLQGLDLLVLDEQS